MGGHIVLIYLFVVMIKEANTMNGSGQLSFFYFFGILLVYILYLLSPHIIVVINILYKLQDSWIVDL